MPSDSQLSSQALVHSLPSSPLALQPSPDHNLRLHASISTNCILWHPLRQAHRGRSSVSLLLTFSCLYDWWGEYSWITMHLKECKAWFISVEEILLVDDGNPRNWRSSWSCVMWACPSVCIGGGSSFWGAREVGGVMSVSEMGWLGLKT